MALTLTWESSYKDWVAAQRLHRWSSRQGVYFVLTNIVVPLLGIFPMWLWVRASLSGDMQTANQQSGWAFGILAFTVVTWVTRVRAFRRGYRNSWPSNVEKRINSLTFSDSGINSTTQGVGSSNLQWDIFCRVVENKSILLLYMTKTRWLIIPQAAISPKQKLELDALIEAHIGGRRC